MKKRIMLGILCGVIITILGIVLYAWSTTRNIQVLQELDASAIRRIEIWSYDKPAVINEPEVIQRFVDILQSTRIHKRKSPDRAGGWISVDIFYNNGIREEMAIAIDQINFDDGEYKSVENIYDDIDALYEEFIIITPDEIEDIETGDGYILEKKTLFGWKKVNYAYYEEDEIESSAVAWIMPQNASTDWKEEWEWLYGELSPGTYRIGKEFHDFYKPGRFEEEMFYAEFEIEKE